MYRGSLIRDRVNWILTSCIYRLGGSIVFLSKKGVKSINPLYGQLSIDTNSECYYNAETLFLDPDYLVDEFTLLGKNILSSPHYELMTSLVKNEKIGDTDYVKRFISGTLDGRIPGYFSKKYENMMHSKFEQRKRELSDNSYAPVLTYVRDGKRYIYDGKHRAALAAVFDKKIKCIDVRFVGKEDGFINWKIKKMIKRKELYTKTLDFYNVL